MFVEFWGNNLIKYRTILFNQDAVSPAANGEQEASNENSPQATRHSSLKEIQTHVADHETGDKLTERSNVVHKS